ncbi:MAG: hypothetical protein HUU50_04250 [Candidatus Brocadiae bacterium]|nr:hypothetical protein [Candidatus Brocadiia bacterium]
MTISASSTPLKRYALRCHQCNEEAIVLPSNTPDEPFCTECNENIDLDDLQSFIASWTEYLQDRIALLEKEKENEDHN